jgi:hypothetical protein
MATFLNPDELAKAFPLKPVRKIGVNEGRVAGPLGLSFKWKVTGDESGYAFAVYEMKIEPCKLIFSLTNFAIGGHLEASRRLEWRR